MGLVYENTRAHAFCKTRGCINELSFLVLFPNQNNQKVHSFYVNPKYFFSSSQTFFLVWIHKKILCGDFIHLFHVALETFGLFKFF